MAKSNETRKVPVSRYVLYFGALIAGCLLDLGTKAYVFRNHFSAGQRTAENSWWIDGWLGIQTSTNQGALFGMGQGGSLWFALLSFVALVGILFWLFVRGGGDRWLTTALGAISGGILGNLYDRLGFWHGMSEQTFQGKTLHPTQVYAVRDWIHFRWEDGPFRIFDPWPNFNVADMLLVCGAIALFLHAMFFRPAKSDEKQAESSSPDSNSEELKPATVAANSGSRGAESRLPKRSKSKKRA